MPTEIGSWQLRFRSWRGGEEEKEKPGEEGVESYLKFLQPSPKNDTMLTCVSTFVTLSILLLSRPGFQPACARLRLLEAKVPSLAIFVALFQALQKPCCLVISTIDIAYV